MYLFRSNFLFRFHPWSFLCIAIWFLPDFSVNEHFFFSGHLSTHIFSLPTQFSPSPSGLLQLCPKILSPNLLRPSQLSVLLLYLIFCSPHLTRSEFFNGMQKILATEMFNFFAHSLSFSSILFFIHESKLNSSLSFRIPGYSILPPLSH